PRQSTNRLRGRLPAKKVPSASTPRRRTSSFCTSCSTCRSACRRLSAVWTISQSIPLQETPKNSVEHERIATLCIEVADGAHDEGTHGIHKEVAHRVVQTGLLHVHAEKAVHRKLEQLPEDANRFRKAEGEQRNKEG